MSTLPDDNTVHVWLAPEKLLDDPANAERFTGLMTDEELARDRRFLAEPPRRLYRLARGLQREVLSTYLPGTTPRELRFVASDTGRPALGPPFAAGGIDFNLAHTRGLVVLAVARGKVGIDVEIYEKRASLDVARRFFSVAEVEELQALPADAQPRRFFRLWTLKESYLKAIGTGIAGGLGDMTFRIDDAGACAFERAADPAAARWSFSQFDVGDQHVLALAHLPARETDVRMTLQWHDYRGAAAPTAATRVTSLISGVTSLLPAESGQEQRAEP